MALTMAQAVKLFTEEEAERLFVCRWRSRGLRSTPPSGTACNATSRSSISRSGRSRGVAPTRCRSTFRSRGPRRAGEPPRRP